MRRYERLNKLTVWQNLATTFFACISMFIQVYYFFAYTDQGSLYQIIKNQEFVIYVFCAFVYLWVFWKLCKKEKSDIVRYFLSVLTPTFFTTHFVLYYNYTRTSISSSPETVQELLKALIKNIGNDLKISNLKYIIAFMAILTICLIVAIVTPDKLLHKIHIFKMTLRTKQGLSVYTVKDLNEVFEAEVFVGEEETHYFAPVDANGQLLLEDTGKLEIIFEAHDRDNCKRYLVFYDSSDIDNLHIAIAASIDRKSKKLTPVGSQRILDKLEQLLIKY